jgi:probable rRNA maturation factor
MKVTMDLDILIEDDRWDSLGFDGLAQAAITSTLLHIGIEPSSVEVSLLACDDARIAELNAEFRGKPLPTNVLSWPSEDLSAEKPGAVPNPPHPDPGGALSLGDIAISYDTCQSEARTQNKLFSAHVTHLVVHGMLHLLGYDHIRGPDATLMETIETEILGKMGIDDPY